MRTLLMVLALLAVPVWAQEAPPSDVPPAPPVAVPSATPTLAARRDALQAQLQTLLQQQQQLSIAIERTRGAIAVLTEYAPPDPPAALPPK